MLKGMIDMQSSFDEKYIVVLLPNSVIKYEIVSSNFEIYQNSTILSAMSLNPDLSCISVGDILGKTIKIYSDGKK